VASARKRFVEKTKSRIGAYPIDSSKALALGGAILRLQSWSSQFGYKFLQLTLVKQNDFLGVFFGYFAVARHGLRLEHGS
jgi:hypothetical protein